MSEQKWEAEGSSQEILDDNQELKEEKPQAPRKYRVVLYNDDYTTFDFVIMILEKIFQHSRSQAEAISWKVHQEGKGVAGVYFKEIAENKVAKTLQLATLYEYPLRCVFEPESQEE